MQGYDTELACINQYKTSLAQKAALIVVDDVWNKSDLDPFLAESPRSRLLFTTRDASIARFIGAQEHTAELLDLRQSRGAPGRLGRAPLEAAASGSGRHHLRVWEPSAGALGCRRAVARRRPRGMERYRGAVAEGRPGRHRRPLPPGQESFFRAVEVSFKTLAPEMKKRYQALAVLLEDMAAPLPILETLCNVNDAEARRISRHLVDRSLAQWGGAEHEGAEQEDAEQGAKTGSICLHDLQLDYVRAQYPDRQAPDPMALDLIQGALRLSSHVIERDPRQFASQLLGRLLPHVQPQGVFPLIPAIQQFTSRLTEGAPRPWLRLVWPALHPPGTALLRTLAGHSHGSLAWR